MAKNSAVNLDITNNADGFDIAGGVIPRKLTLTGTDITMTGSGSNTFTYPAASDTLVGRTSTDTLTNKTINTASNIITVVASDVSDFDTEVSNNSSVSDNTTHRGLTTGNPHSLDASDVGLGNVSNVATDDTTYNATSWDTNLDAATKNAIRDKVETMDTAIGLNTAKDTNVTTNLSEGTSTTTTVDVNSSDGTNATLVSASTTRAGLLTKAKWDEIVLNNAKITNATHTGDVTGDTALAIGVDKVLDTHINWGTGATQVSTADIPEQTNLYYTEARVSANTDVSSNTTDRHTESHTIASHSDTTATGTELDTLTDNSLADTLHRHSELVASDGSPDPALIVDIDGNVSIGTTNNPETLNIEGTMLIGDTTQPNAYGATLAVIEYGPAQPTGTDQGFTSEKEITSGSGTGSAFALAGSIFANGGDYSNCIAVDSIVRIHNGSNVPVASALRGVSMTTGTGTIGVATGITAEVRSYGGPIDTGYGLFIKQVDGTENWGLFQENSNNKNYFAGDVGIGTDSPITNLDINGGFATNIVTKTTTYTATTSDYTILADGTTAGFTITLPAASTVTGIIYNIKKIDSTGNTITIDANLTETIDGTETQTISTQYENLTIQCDGSNWHII